MERRKRTDTDDLAGKELRRQQLPNGLFTPEDSIAHSFLVVVNRVSQMLEKMYRDRYGLTVVGWRLMAIIHNHSPLSAKRLAEFSAMDQVSISRALDQLVSRKFVLRRTDPTDRRRLVLRLSKKGEAVYNDILPLSYATDQALLSVLSEDEVRQMRGIVEKVVDRSAETLSEEQGWLSVLSCFGYRGSAAIPVPDSSNIATPEMPDEQPSSDG